MSARSGWPRSVIPSYGPRCPGAVGPTQSHQTRSPVSGGLKEEREDTDNKTGHGGWGGGHLRGTSVRPRASEPDPCLCVRVCVWVGETFSSLFTLCYGLNILNMRWNIFVHRVSTA